MAATAARLGIFARLAGLMDDEERRCKPRLPDFELETDAVKMFLPMIAGGLAACLLSAPAFAADAASAKDRAFVAKVSQGGMFEVMLGDLATSQGATQDIRDQGATEEHDHKLVGDKLKSIASDDGIETSDTLNAKFQGQLDSLKGMSGAGFDRAYLRQMEAVHAADGAAFAKEAKEGGDPKLRAFAAETHRIVVRHIGELRAQP